MGDGVETERDDQAVERIGGRGAEAGNEAGTATSGERAAKAEQTDRADGDGDGDAQQEALEEGGYGGGRWSRESRLSRGGRWG